MKKKKSKFLRVLKRIKIHHLLFLIVLLTANAFAWFVYVSRVDNSIDVYVKAWNIDFENDDEEIVDYVNFTVDSIYPGMTTYSRDVVAHNYSDVSASLSYSILEYSIMGESYTTVEGKNDAGLTPDGTEYTSDEIKAMLENDYPFHITFTTSSTVLQPNNGSATYTSKIIWPYESGGDELDTTWGIKAYDYKTLNPGEPCIFIRVKIYITQNNN